MYRLWVHGLYGLYGPRCLLSPERLLNLITHSPPYLEWSLTIVAYVHTVWFWCVRPYKALMFTREFNGHFVPCIKHNRKLIMRRIVKFRIGVIWLFSWDVTCSCLLQTFLIIKFLVKYIYPSKLKNKVIEIQSDEEKFFINMLMIDNRFFRWLIQDCSNSVTNALQ